MNTPRTISKDELQAFWNEVRADFPDDEMMQEIHFVRLLHAAQLDNFTPKERAEYFNSFIAQSSEAADSAEAP